MYSAVLLVFYLAANAVITARAEQLTARAVEQRSGITPSLVVANPVEFWKREMLWRDNTHYGRAIYQAPDTVRVDEQFAVHQVTASAAANAPSKDENAKAFLFWSRML